jgi:3-polyprenyl-4-hydroxybenzoate decarboxylase
MVKRMAEEGSIFEKDGRIEVFEKDEDTGKFVNIRDAKIDV